VTSPIIAVTIWLQLLFGQPIALAVGALALIACLVWFRRALTFLLVAMVLAQFSVAAQSHSELRVIASEFQSRFVELEAIQSGNEISKVKLLSLQGCDSCEGAYGQFSGSLKDGDKVSGTLLIRPSFGFGEFVAKGNGDVVAPNSSAIAVVHSAFTDALTGLSVEARALVAGLAIGDTSLLTESLNEDMKTLSLTHLNAVSGANCAIVIGAVFWLLGFLTRRRWLRVTLAIFALGAYVLLVGGGASVIRAAIMAIVVLVLLQRGVWPVAALSFTAILMLLWDPNYAEDYGFALSVFATAGILIIAPELSKRLSTRMPKALSLALAVTISAQLWCMPILLELQDGVPTYAVLANLLAEPVVAPITVLGISAAAVAYPLPWLASVLTWLASVLSQWIVAVARGLASLPEATLAWHTGVIGMAILVFGASLWLLRSKRLGALAVALVLITEVVWSGASLVRSTSWLVGDWQFVNCDVGQGDALVIRSRRQIALVDVGREPQPIDSCLRQLGVSKIDLLVLTHFDADHVGGLAGALAGRTVERALLSPFDDTRPLAKLSMSLLEKLPSVTKAGIGTNGLLGGFAWQVLSPTITAAETADSNDASLAMRWESEDLVAYTMADLGEPAQQRMVQNFGGYLNHPKSKPLVLKVSHHGSADQFHELIEAMHPEIAIISVGKENSYGHPTNRTLDTLKGIGAVVLRTDLNGSIGVFSDLRYAVSGGS
jgi:competence protein ComEC